LSERKQLARVVQQFIQPVERFDYAFERRTLLAERLRTRRIGPDVGRFELPVDLLEPLAFLLVVKDTP
jgi:hypothetical protein